MRIENEIRNKDIKNIICNNNYYWCSIYNVTEIIVTENLAAE